MGLDFKDSHRSISLSVSVQSIDLNPSELVDNVRNMNKNTFIFG